MKGEFFRPCPKCGKICNAELDMCEICSGKIAKPEQPKPIIPVVTPVVEPIVEEVAPVVEEQVATEEVIEEVATEENVVEETTNEEKQEEVVVPVIETKAPKGKGTKGLYALVAVLMLVIVALIVVIMQDKQPDIAVNNTTLQSNTTTSTTLKQETETTTEITEGTIVDNAGETLDPVTTTKKAQNTSKETTTKKNTSSSTKETTTKKITTTTTTEVNKVEFNPEIVYSKDEVYRVSLHASNSGEYEADVKIKNAYNVNEEGAEGFNIEVYIELQIIKIYCWDTNGELKEVSGIEFTTIRDREVYTCDFTGYAYNKDGELYCEDTIWLFCYEGDKVKPGYSFTDMALYYHTSADVNNISKIVIKR